MKKKIILAGAISCLLISSVHAAVDKPEGWYLKGSYADLLSSKKYHNLGAAAASAGYKKGYLRGEAQLGYARVRESLCLSNVCGLVSKGNNFNLGLHGFLDLDNSTMISPYLGLGVEKNTYKAVFAPHVNKVHAVGHVGARAYFTENLALDVGYKTRLAHTKEGGAGSIGLAWHFD